MELLEGEEASIFGFSDGQNIVCIVPSQDHKTIGEGDVGLNTGGMGAYAPAPVITPELFDEIVQRIMKPTIRALALEGRPYRGILFGGIIVTPAGPKVIEFNCRMGDPEAQVVLPCSKPTSSISSQGFAMALSRTSLLNSTTARRPAW